MKRGESSWIVHRRNFRGGPGVGRVAGRGSAAVGTRLGGLWHGSTQREASCSLLTCSLTARRNLLLRKRKYAISEVDSAESQTAGRARDSVGSRRDSPSGLGSREAAEEPLKTTQMNGEKMRDTI